MNIKRVKERFWVAMFVESPVARNPLAEFVLGLFEKEEEEKESPRTS